jgi:hypothetical protein
MEFLKEIRKNAMDQGLGQESPAPLQSRRPVPRSVLKRGYHKWPQKGTACPILHAKQDQVYPLGVRNGARPNDGPAAAGTTLRTCARWPRPSCRNCCRKPGVHSLCTRRRLRCARRQAQRHRCCRWLRRRRRPRRRRPRRRRPRRRRPGHRRPRRDARRIVARAQPRTGCAWQASLAAVKRRTAGRQTRSMGPHQQLAGAAVAAPGSTQVAAVKDLHQQGVVCLLLARIMGEH